MQRLVWVGVQAALRPGQLLRTPAWWMLTSRECWSTGMRRKWSGTISLDLMLSMCALPHHIALDSLTSQIKPEDTSLLVTEPYFNLPNVAETYDQMIFEEWEFASYYRCTRESWPIFAAQLIMQRPPLYRTVVSSRMTPAFLPNA